MQCKDVVRAVLMIGLGGMLSLYFSSSSSSHNYEIL